jgi:hypothetical protein
VTTCSRMAGSSFRTSSQSHGRGNTSSRVMEKDLIGIVGNIKDQRSMFELDFRYNADCTATRGNQ